MSAASPPLTVLMPVYNGAAHLRAALDSVFAQTFADFELLVVDDGSTDSTAEILRGTNDRRLRVVTNPQNLGLVGALNRGLGEARGEFIARHDHDDLSHPERFQKQTYFLRTHPDCPLVGTEAFQTDVQGRPTLRLLRPCDPEGIRWYLCFDNAFIHSSVMFRRAVIVRDFGGYPAFPICQDYCLWSRIARERPVANLPEPLVFYREHVSSMTGALSGSQALKFEEETTAIRWEYLHAVFGDSVTPEDARILSTYRRDFGLESADAFLRVFDRLSRVHAATFSESAGVRRARAIQLADLAYRLLPVARWKALTLYRRAFVLSPPIARQLPWPRIAALFFLGERARALYLAVFGRR